MKTCCALLVLLGHYLTSYAQNPVYRAIDKTTGLPTNTIYDIFQDAEGFIWIGHDKGLSKYDGFRFKHYQNEEQRGRPLSNILQDETGKIWCQNFVGQFFFIESDTLKLSKQLEPTGLYIPAGMLNGKVLVSTGKKGLRFLNTKTLTLDEKVLENFSTNHYTISTKESYYFFNKNSGRLLITDAQGRIREEEAPLRLNYFYPLPTSYGFYYVPKYPDKNVNLINWNTKENSFTFPPKTFIQNTSFLTDSLISIITSTGFYLFNNKFQPYPDVHNHFFKNKNISALLRDHEGNWWIGTLNEGILFVPNLTTLRKFEEQSFTAIRSNRRNNSLYIGTVHNEVLEYSLHKQRLNKVFTNEINQEVITIFYDSATEDLGYASNNVFIYSKNKKAIKQDGSIKDIHKLDGDHYVVAASGFIGICSSEKIQANQTWIKAYKNIGFYQGDDSTQFRLNDTEVRARALALTKDTIYAATTNGLLAYTLKGPIEIKYNGKSVIAADLESYEKSVFAASFNDGLLKVENGELRKLFTPDQSTIGGIFKLKIVKGIAWMLTETNLIAYDLQAKSVKLIDQTNGLPMDDLRDFSIMNDTVFMVGNKGLVYFPATLSSSNKVKPSLIINSFVVNQKKEDITKNINLSSNENDIVINYSVIAYKAGSNVKVEYNINDSEWRLLENTNRELRLASLAPGFYIIGLRANDDAGALSKQVLINFTISKPLYLEVWFITFCLALLIVFIYLHYKQRLAKIRYQNKLETDRLQLEQELQQSLLASIKAQMNPHFIYNSLSSIHAFVYSDDKENAIKYLDRFSELTRKVLELSGHESILLSEEIELLETYISLEKMRFGETFQSSIICAEDIDVHFVKLPSMIIQPFVENAIKHGLLHRKGDKQLHITFTKQKDDLLIIIEDNGVGRKVSSDLKSNKNKKHASFSISANRKRLELLNAKKKNTIGLQIVDKTDEMGRGCGTKVFITIPTQFS